jgi:flagellar basal-body rod protein FlgC
MKGIFSTIEISGTGMSVQRRKMNVVAQNIANAETTRTEEGGPYRRKKVEVSSENEKLPFETILHNTQGELSRTHRSHIPSQPFESGDTAQVAVAKGEEISEGEDSYRLLYDPTHPDADEKGYVKMPNIDIINEMVDMMAANRAYEANANAVASYKEMLKGALDI